LKLYHGTDGQNIRRILRDGIHPRKLTRKNNWGHSLPSNPHAVYLTTAYAGYFALLAAKQTKLGIIEIDSDLLNEDLLRPDEDFLEQATRKPESDMREQTKMFRDNIDDYSHLWKKSLEHLGTCSYVGKIPATAITRASVLDYKKNPFIGKELLQPTITIANFRFCGDRYKALTAWLVGEDISADTLLMIPRDQLSQIPAETRRVFEVQAGEIQRQLADRSGLTIMKLTTQTVLK
jgi:hypothetical protein